MSRSSCFNTHEFLLDTDVIGHACSVFQITRNWQLNWKTNSGSVLWNSKIYHIVRRVTLHMHGSRGGTGGQNCFRWMELQTTLTKIPESAPASIIQITKDINSKGFKVLNTKQKKKIEKLMKSFGNESFIYFHVLIFIFFFFLGGGGGYSSFSLPTSLCGRGYEI